MDAAADTIYTRIFRARLARCMAGSLLILTAIAMVIGSVVAQVGAQILLLGWVISLLALPIGSTWTPMLEPRAAAERLATWSLRLPMLGLALVMPMTLHIVVMGSTGILPFDMFSSWIAVSSLVVSPAYVVLLWLLYQDAEHICTDDTPKHWQARSWAALWKTTLASCVPGIVLILPPIITFVTGAIFIPAMYFFSHRIRSWERTEQDWLSLARRVGLQATTVLPYNLPSLTGIVDGVRIEVSGWRTTTGSMVFELEAALGNPALLHLNISADPNDPAQIRLGEPVADAVLRIFSTQHTSADALAELLRDADRYAALMAVVHGLGGRVSLGRIRLRLPAASITPLWDALPKVIELAQLMRSSPASAPASHAVISPPQPLRQASPAG